MFEVAAADPRWNSLREALVDWASGNPREFPWRRDLPKWQALVSEILLQRTRAASVTAMYDDFFERFDSPARMASATEEEIRESMWSLGLLWRAKYLKELGAALENTAVPETDGELRQLPGVGPYAAGAYLALHQNRPAMFVDANVVRLMSRFWGFTYDGETRRKRWFLNLVQVLFSHGYEPQDFGYSLLDFTREVCGVSPRCDECGASGHCNFSTEANVAQI